ncbi:hypothetical protein ATANTOWER_024021 [Ataeniobius toweri]|uniref:Uncharacterized protein n=1 Tax=Ataeniobius toweri TaxID=208326 RepID=A0ABU7AQR6_9TELE|nr:hypothetical protein [Ataeniobius toweri]
MQLWNMEKVVALQHLWLTLTDLPESQLSEFLRQVVEATEAFGQALKKRWASSDKRKKQEETPRLSMLRQHYSQTTLCSDLEVSPPRLLSLTHSAIVWHYSSRTAC